MKLILPWPDSKLMPNKAKGTHWKTTSAARTKANETAYALAMEVKPRCFKHNGEPVPIAIFFCPPDKRRRDLDNLLASMKPQIDGVSKALGIDDSLFRPITIDFGEVVKGGEVRVTLYEIT